jgi:hypothetical protein
LRIWTDEELITKNWYIDGELVASNSMTYDWVPGSGAQSIVFQGSNAAGSVIHVWDMVNEAESPAPSGSAPSFTPSSTSVTSSVGESTTFIVDSGQEFTSALWYIDDELVQSGATTYVQDWDAAGTYAVRFDGVAAAGTLSRTWTVFVSEPEYSTISISPSTAVVAPGESFSLDVYIDPKQSLTGSQFDLHYSHLADVTAVSEGDLFSIDGVSTTFAHEGFDNTVGLLRHVYAAIMGSGSIAAPGAMATVEMVAGSSTGVLELNLANVILSDTHSQPALITASNATVLIDTAPVFDSLAVQSVDEGSTLSFTVSASDADGDPLSYSATTLPEGASFSDRTFTWTPSLGDAGSYEAGFEVTDGYLTDSMTVGITVKQLNNVPVITLFEPADGSVFEEGSTINVSIEASDADGDSLSYVIRINGSQVSTGTSYVWPLDYSSAGTYAVEAIVTDGIDEVSAMHTITVTDLHPRWDVNQDGVVNILDITLVGQNYGATYESDLPRWDVNQDGVVNIQDLSIVAGRFGELV